MREPVALDIASRCLLMRTRRLSRAVTRAYLSRMGDCGLDVSQFTLLAAVGAYPGARAADLAPALDLEKSTLSREIRGLLEVGLLTAEADGRAQRLGLSPAGARLLEDAYPAWEAAQRDAARALGPLADALLAHFPPGDDHAD